MRIRDSFVVIVLLLSAVQCPATDIDWSKARAEAVQLLQELIRIDTTNPPGNELAAALHIQKLLEAEGIETKVLDVTPGRANLYARIKGDGSRRPLILLSHLATGLDQGRPQDAGKDDWSIDLFACVSAAK